MNPAMTYQTQGPVYTDLQGLADLRADGKDKAAQMVAAAEQFSAVFTHMMLKSMRQAELAEGIFDNQQSNFYRDMFDQQIALHLSSRDGVGFANLLVDYLSDVSGIGAGTRAAEAYGEVQDLAVSADTPDKDA